MVAAKTVHTDPVDQVKNRIIALERRVEELTRRSPSGVVPPICRVQLNVDTALSASVEMFAQANWVIGEDPNNNSTLSPTAGIYSYITAPISGRYLVQNRGVFTSPAASATMLSFITVNGTDSTLSVARDNKNSSSAGTDGTIVNAVRPVYLDEDDRIYWGYWSSQACTLSATLKNVPTEVSITYLGGR